MISMLRRYRVKLWPLMLVNVSAMIERVALLKERCWLTVQKASTVFRDWKGSTPAGRSSSGDVSRAATSGGYGLAVSTVPSLPCCWFIC